MHVRSQIRAYVAAKLTAIDGLQDHITIEAADIPDEAELPWALVSIGDEAITGHTIGGLTRAARLAREATMTVDVVGRDRLDVVGKVEDIAADIERLLATDPLLGGLAKASELRALTVERVRRVEGSQPTIALRLQYLITYMTAADDPRTAL